ncbi:MAG TPA: hypothetical protein VLI06_05990 [Solimonas sp.]|nr:hypothetical protein [Solimonas sp.]
MLFASLEVLAAPAEGLRSYDPLAQAMASVGRIANREAVIPPQCYTKTGGVSNPCWTCHTQRQGLNQMDDWRLQLQYAFSDEGVSNHWSNLFLPAASSNPSAAAVRDYIRSDNYTPLRQALAAYTGQAAWLPDLDIHAGFDEAGFARDGSGWRAVRFKPFPGTFWPTNGSTDDVMIRLPWEFRIDATLAQSNEIYRLNLAIVEATMATPSPLVLRDTGREVEAVDEALLQWDLDDDGRIGGQVRRIRSLPPRYAGAARAVRVEWGSYPAGTEFLHSVRYLDADAPNFMSVRMKELRYSVKWRGHAQALADRFYEEEKHHKDTGVLPLFKGRPDTGYVNDFGWKLQGYIEDAQGRLRLQTQEEHYYCMGCHGTIGVTADQTFAFPRKLPGAEGWKPQTLVGQRDVPQWSHPMPEVLTYLQRVGGADEFRSNDEMLRRFFRRGTPREDLLLSAAASGSRDLAWLLHPSPARALALNRAYMRLVKLQRFDLGRDAVLKPAVNVHRRIESGSTGFNEEAVHRDGSLWLDWN